MKKSYFTFLLIFSTSLFAGNTITILCPPVNQIRYTPIQEPWATFKYTASMPIDLPRLGNLLSFIGEGHSNAAKNMDSAVWTDDTLNCNYNGDQEYMVLTSVDLSHELTGCYFKTPPADGCQGSTPEDCPMTCKKILR